ncbi:MAG: hypothetical protein H6555_08165 [Lewinellaceae bacterium]|nr:hypothetical protein [Lewinellaceae bacterium]
MRLLSFELRYQLRRFSFLLFIVGYGGAGFALGVNSIRGTAEVGNAPYQLFFHLGLLSLTLVFPLMFMVVGAALRDHQHRFTALIGSTSVSQPTLVLSRLAGVWLGAITLLGIATLTFEMGVYGMTTDDTLLAGVYLQRWLNVFGILLLPTASILTILLFAIGWWTQNARAVYLAALLVYLLYWVSAMYLNSPLLANAKPADPAMLWLAGLLDPFGLSAFFDQTQFWTITDKNTLFLQFKGALLWNRLGWLSMGGMVILGLSRLAPPLPRHHSGRVSSKAEAPLPHFSKAAYPTVLPQISRWSYAQMVGMTLLRFQVRFLFRSLPFLLSLLSCLIIVAIETYSYLKGGGSYREFRYPGTSILIGRMADPLFLFGALLILFYSAELADRNQRVNIRVILDATPAPQLVQFLSQFCTLLAIPLTLWGAVVGLGIGIQRLEGFTTFNPGTWLAMGYFQGSRLAWLCLFTLTLQWMVRSKYLGMGLNALLLLLLGSSITNEIGIHHPLLQPGRLPVVLPTEMNGYARGATWFHLLHAYWWSFALLLTGFIPAFYAGSVRRTLSWFRPRTLWAWWLIPGLAWLGIGGWIWRELQLDKAYFKPSLALDIREDYERKFQQYADLPLLSYDSMQHQIDLFPATAGFYLTANYTLINNQTEPVKQLFVSPRLPLDSLWIEGARREQADSLHQTSLWVFNRPIDPGEHVRIHYRIHYEAPVFAQGREVVANGSYLSNRFFEPVFSYRKSKEIEDPQERQRRGLPSRDPEIVTEDHLQEQSTGLPRVYFHAIVSTESGQTALAPGKQLRTWETGKRVYFEYQPTERILPVVNYFSARYAFRQRSFDNITLEYYTHPHHEINLDSIDRYVRATLEYCQRTFSPYPFDHLRMAEIPSHWPFGGQALSGTISMVSDRLYLSDIRRPQQFNIIAKRTIHEVAHQWWGHHLAPKNTAGAALLIEGLAKYTEAMVMKNLYGEASLRDLTAESHHRYFTGRTLEQLPEPPLYLQEGQGYLAYGKSLHALLATRELLGEAAFHQVLRNLINRYGQQTQPTLTTLDFLNALAVITPANQSLRIQEWYREVILHDLSLEHLQIEQQDNTYWARGVIRVGKQRLTEDGIEQLSPAGEWLTLGIFRQGILTARQRVILTGETTPFRIDLGPTPATLILDPDRTRMNQREP